MKSGSGSKIEATLQRSGTKVLKSGAKGGKNKFHAQHHTHGNLSFELRKEQLLDRIVFPWVSSAKHKEEAPLQFEQITAHEVISGYGVPRHVVTEYVSREVTEAAACKSMFLTFFLVFTFFGAVIGHVDYKTLGAVEESIKTELVEQADFEEASSYTDCWSFINSGLYPLLIRQEVAWSENGANFSVEPLPENHRGLVTVYNRVVGGIRLRQQRNNVQKCHPMGSRGAECTDGPGHDRDPDLKVARHTEADETRTVWIWIDQPEGSMRSLLHRLEADDWIDGLTSKVEISVPVFNAEYGVHTLVTVNYFFSKGGRIWSRVLAQSGFADWYTTEGVWLWDVAYLVAVFITIVREVRNIVRSSQRYGCPDCMWKYMSAAKVCDWLVILTNLGIVSYWINLLALTSMLNRAAVAAGRNRHRFLASSHDYSEIKEYVTYLQDVVSHIARMFDLVTFFPLWIAIVFFIVFHGQPRMALVTKTIRQSGVQLVHFVVVAGCTFWAFTVSGHILFGRYVDEFADMFGGVVFCVQVLLVEFDFDGMQRAGFFASGAWLVLFTILVSMLLLKMFLSIILSAYREIQSEIASAEDLVQEAEQMIIRARGMVKGTLVPLRHILKALTLREPRRKRRGRRRLPRSELDDAAEEATCSKSTIATGRSLDTRGSKSVTFWDSTAPRTPTTSAGVDDFVRMTMTASINLVRFGGVAGADKEQMEWDNQLLVEDDLIEMVNKLPRSTPGLRNFQLGPEQAYEILRGSVHKFYKRKKRVARMEEFRRLVGDIYVRGRQMLAEGSGSTKSERVPAESMRRLRADLVDFVRTTSQERAAAATKLARLRAEVAMLRELVLPAETEDDPPKKDLFSVVYRTSGASGLAAQDVGSKETNRARLDPAPEGAPERKFSAMDMVRALLDTPLQSGGGSRRGSYRPGGADAGGGVGTTAPNGKACASAPGVSSARRWGQAVPPSRSQEADEEENAIDASGLRHTDDDVSEGSLNFEDVDAADIDYMSEGDFATRDSEPEQPSTPGTQRPARNSRAAPPRTLKSLAVAVRAAQRARIETELRRQREEERSKARAEKAMMIGRTLRLSNLFE